MMTKSLILPILLSGVSLTLAAQDSARLRNGTVESGRIESEDLDGLKLKVKKGKEEQVLKLAWADVLEVTYGGELQQAIGQLSTGNRGAALPRLQAMIAGTTLRKELRPAALYQLGIGQMRSSQFKEAAATLLDLVKTNPKSRYLLPGTRALVEIHLVSGDLDGGAAALEAAATAAKDAGVQLNDMLAFDYFRGLLSEGKKDLVKAKVSFQAAARADQKTSEFAELAKLGIARIDEAAGQTEEARNAYRAIIEQGRSNEVLAGAWNGLAKMALKDAKGQDAAKVNDALFMFLRGVVEYAPASGEGTNEHERALAGAAEAFRQLADLDKDEAQKKLNTTRSRQRIDQLRKEFPHSAHLPK